MRETGLDDGARWLLLIHQLPPKPSYVRVKIARHMQRIGAVPIKNTVYVLPSTPATLEDFQWAAREIRDSGGEANLFESRVVEGLSDSEVQQLFNTSRDEEYAPVVSEARALLKAASRKRRDLGQIASELKRLRKRAVDIAALDFFGAANGHLATALLDEIGEKLAGSSAKVEPRPEKYSGRTWVTRTGVHIDRMCSAWLIRRFIDAEAKFKFVAPRDYAPRSGEIRFDMFDAEFTHDGDRCTFEVLLDRTGLNDRALRAIGEVVHDIDLKDARFARPETAGLAVVVAAIAIAHDDDASRIARATAVLDDLYLYYSKKR